MHRYLIMLIWETKLNWNCCQAIFVKPGYCWRPQLIISHQIYFLCQKVFLKLQTLGKDFFTSRQWCHAVFIMLLQMTFLHQTNAATTQRTQQLPEHDAQTGNPAYALIIEIHNRANYSSVQWSRIPATSCTKYISCFVTHNVHKPVTHHLEICVQPMG